MLRRPALPALLSFLALVACDTGLVPTLPDGSDPNDPQPRTDAVIQISAGGNQEGAVGAPLTDPVVATVRDSDGTVLSGVPVLWAFEDGRGRSAGDAGSWAAVASTTSDAQGRASVQWELGAEPGAQRAAVRVGGTTSGSAPLIFSATAVAGPAMTLSVAPDLLTLGLGESLQLTVTGTDAFGNSASTANAVWSSSTPGVASVSGSGLLSAQSAGQSVVTASVGGAQDQALVTVEAGPPPPQTGTFEIVHGNGQSGPVAVQLSQTLRVRLRDDGGQPIQGQAVSWAVLPGNGSLSVSTAVTDAAGLAESSWTLGSATGAQSVRASTAALSPLVFSATAVAGPPASLAVSPDQGTLDPGQTLQLSVTGIDGFGNAVSTTGALWSSSAPSVATVSGAGLATALTAGQATIFATLDGVSGVANLTVDAAAEQPGTLEIVQGNGQNGPVGQPLGQTLRVRVRDTGAKPMQGQTVTWYVLSGGGSLSSTTITTDAAGIGETSWTLGSSAGTQSVRASVASVSSVTFSATAVAPPPPPSGQTIFFQEGFENSQFASRGWYDNVSMTRTTSEVHSGAGAVEFRFNAGQILPVFGNSARHMFEESESLYVRYWVKYSENWIGSGVAYHPHEIYVLTNQEGPYVGPSTTHLTSYIETRFLGGQIRPVLSIGDRLNIDAANVGVDLTGVTENRAVAGCNGNTDGYATGCYNSGSGWANEKIWTASGSSISRGDWHLVEVYFEMNSVVGGVGIPDGVAQYWLDGSLVLDSQGVLFRTGANADMRFNQFLMAPYIGVGSPATQTMWLDDLLVADRR